MRRIVPAVVVIYLLVSHAVLGGKTSPVSGVGHLYLNTPEGAPAGNVDVWLVRETFAIHGVTDAEGHIEFAVPSGTYRILVADRVHNWTAWQQVQIEAGKALRIRLHAGGVLRGRVLDQDTGDPVEGVRVTADQSEFVRALPGEILERYPGLRAIVRPTVRSDGSGQFEIRGLFPGIVTVTGYGRRYIVLQREIGILPAETHTIDLMAMRGGASLVLRIVDPAGRPVSRARVYVRSTEGRHPGWRSVSKRAFYTDNHGRVRLDGIPSDASFVVHIVDRPRISWRSEPLTLHEGEERGWEIKLPEGNIVTGQVVDESGDPVRNLQPIESVSTPDIAEREWIEVAAWDPPDKRGQFAVRGLPKGTYRIPLIAPGYVPEILTVRITGYGERIDLGRIVLRRGAHISGTVVTEDGHPVAGVRVVASVRGLLEGVGMLPFEAYTDGEGWFTIEGLKADRTYTLRVTGGYVTPESVEVPAGTEGVRIRVVPSGTVRGRLVNPEGDPVPAYVVAIQNKRLSYPPMGQRLDRVSALPPPGVFEIIDLVPRLDVLTIRAPGYGMEARQVQILPGEVTDLGTIVLQPACEIVFRIQNSERRPIPRVAAVLVSLDLLGYSVPELQGLSDASGRIRIPDVRPGRYHVEFSHPDFALTQGRLVIREDCSVAPSVWTLGEGGRLHVCVTDAQGRPVPKKRILIRRKDFMFGVRGLLTTGADGCVLSRRLQSGRYYVLTAQLIPGTKGRYTRVSREVQVENGVTKEVRLSMCSVELRGRLRIGSTPLIRGTVAISTSANEQTRGFHIVQLEGQPEFSACIESSDRIRFWIRDGGVHAWVFTVPLGTVQNPPATASSLWSLTKTEQGWFVDLHLPDATSVVTVTDAQTGVPIADATVKLDLGSVEISCTTTSSGQCALWGVPPVSGKLIVYGPKYMPYQQTVESGLPGTVSVRLGKGGRIFGRLLDLQGQPISGTLLVRIKTLRMYQFVRGDFDIQGVPSGETVTIIAIDTHRRYAPAVAQIRMESTEHQVDLRLQVPAILEVRVQDPERHPVAGAKVNVLLPDGTDITEYCRSDQGEVVTDHRGVARFDRVPGGSLVIRATVGSRIGQTGIMVVPGQAYRVSVEVK